MMSQRPTLFLLHYSDTTATIRVACHFHSLSEFLFKNIIILTFFAVRCVL